MDIIFEWDAAKASLNKKKHNIRFDEAKTVFFDENAIVIHDPEHSVNEERFVILGLSAVARLLVVCHCFRSVHDKIFILTPFVLRRRVFCAVSKHYLKIVLLFALRDGRFCGLLRANGFLSCTEKKFVTPQEPVIARPRSAWPWRSSSSA